MLAQAEMPVVFVIEETITLCTLLRVTAEKKAPWVLSIFKSATETKSFSDKRRGTGKPHKLETQIMVGAL